MNNKIIWGHHGLFMYIDGDYYGSSHNMNILWHFSYTKIDVVISLI